MKPAVSVVVVNWNTRDLLDRCLTALLAAGASIGIEVIVVDNGSTDGSRELVAAAHPEATLIANTRNIGFSAANNQGIGVARGRYVLLLNSDTEVEDGALAVLVDFGDAHPRAGILGPRLLNLDGTLQPSGARFPTPLSTAASVLGLGRLLSRPRYGTRRDYSVPAVVDEVSGAAMLVRAEVVDAVGGLDESFSWGYEDVDFCRRVKAAGWEIHYVPAAGVRHQWGASRRLAPASTVLKAIEGRRHYFRKHHGAASAALVMAATLLSHLLRSLVFALGGVFDRRLCARAATEREIAAALLRTLR